MRTVAEILNDIHEATLEVQAANNQSIRFVRTEPLTAADVLDMPIGDIRAAHDRVIRAQERLLALVEELRAAQRQV